MSSVSYQATTAIVALFDPRGGALVSEVQAPDSGAGLIDPEMFRKMSPEQQVRMMEAMAKMQGAQRGAATVSTTAAGAQAVFYRIDDPERIRAGSAPWPSPMPASPSTIRPFSWRSAAAPSIAS